jgi:hypothetical protein
LSIGVAAALYWCAIKLSFPSLILSLSIKLLIFIAFPIALYLVGFFKDDEITKLKRTVQSLWANRRWSATVLPEQ